MPILNSSGDFEVKKSTKATSFVIGTTTIRAGAGTPEGAVVGAVGDLYLRTNGGAGTTLYIKESGTGNTGWVGK